MDKDKKIKVFKINPAKGGNIMYARSYRGTKQLSNLFKVMTFLTAILLIFVFTSPAISGEPVGNVYFYNVDNEAFSVVWEVEEESDYCTVLVYSDNSGSPTLVDGYTTTSWAGSADPNIAQERGIMQVRVENLPDPETTYYVQTRSRVKGSSTNIDYPAFGSLLPVTTGSSISESPKDNGILQLALYQINTDFSNILGDGALAIVDAGGDYPVASNNGWPVEFIVNIIFNLLRSGNAYVDWTASPTDHPITIMAFGGKVPDKNVGQRTINTTFPQQLIGTDSGCISDYLTTELGCYFGANQVLLVKNLPPTFNLDTEYSVNRNAQLSIANICATDPDGDPIVPFALDNNPAGMNLVTDGDCFTITWTPTECDHRENIKVIASDDQGNSGFKTFDVIIKHCPPYTPDASVTTLSPVTTDDLICDAVDTGDPDGDTITLIYKWYEAGSPTTVLSSTDTLDSLSTVKGGEYYCVVVANDQHGDSDPKETNHVVVGNSAPGAPGNVEVTPAQPTADDPLTCEIKTASADPDDEQVWYKYRWICDGCGTVERELKTGLTDTLGSGETARGQQWTCEVYATDNIAQSSTVQSNTVTIQNQPPTAPGNVQITNTLPVYTDDPITCEIGIESTDPDEDSVEYKYRWTCTDCGGKPAEESDLKTELTDILPSSKTAKGEQWTCEVWANDGFTDGASVTTSAVTIENSPPEGLSVSVTPDPNASVSDDLLCTATGVTDEDGDAISYRYEWKKGGVTEVTRPFTVGKTSDTLEASETSQGETWSCVVTAKDTSDAEISETSNQVYIYNRPPVITTDPPEPIEWEEGGHHEIRIIVSDPDGNNFTWQLDTNYVDPNAFDWIEYDDANAIITADPPVDSSSLDVDYGPGVFKFNFIVDETDGTPNRHVEKLITATVMIPATTVDDFEYDANAPTLAENGWYKLQGSGKMLLIQEDPNDPNSNHYLKTTVTTTPSNNSQLGYIIYKTLPDGLFDNLYPKIHFSVSDKNLFYIDFRVMASNDETYFLRYIPRDPNAAGWGTQVSGRYVSTNIGTEPIDPNGRVVTEIIRNMDADLFNATGFHYLYLRGIVVRGDVNHLDDIKVSSVARPSLKEVENLTAVGNENQVTLQWMLPPGQADTIAGYNIYMKKGSPPAKDAAHKIVTVGPDKTSHTEKGLDINETYYFIVTAIDNLLVPKETNGKSASAIPIVTIPLAPVELKASSVDRVIELSWKNDPDQYPDLAGYMVYYCDCDTVDCGGCFDEIVAANKADATGLFKHYITKDANQDPLAFDKRYDFTVKAKDTAQPANLSDGVHVSILLVPPTAKSIDNFEYDSLMREGWYRLQGKGQMTLKLDVDGVNHYLEKKGPSDHIIVKWLKDPTDYTNPNFKASVRSQGDFRIDVYLKGKDGKNYFLSYKGNKNTDDDSTTATVEQKRWFVYTIGWQSKASTTEWYPIERNLDDDLMAAKDVGFDMVLGILLRGTLDIDNIELGEGILDVENLTARAGDSEVLLSYSVADPNKIDDTWIYVDDSKVADSNDIDRIAPDKSDYQYLVTGLTNNTEYEFRVVQIVEGEESKGVSVNATPMVYKTDPFTFDDQSDLNEWSLSTAAGVVFDVVYDSGVQSNVMYLDPTGDYPDRYYASKENINVSDVTGMTCRIKTSSNFVIWVDIVDTSAPGIPFMLGFVPGGTKGDSLRFGSFAYYYLGPGYTDGSWHHLDLNLDEIMGSILPGIATDMVKGIYFGGRIYVDDVSLY